MYTMYEGVYDAELINRYTVMYNTSIIWGSHCITIANMWHFHLMFIDMQTVAPTV